MEPASSSEDDESIFDDDNDDAQMVRSKQQKCWKKNFPIEEEEVKSGTDEATEDDSYVSDIPSNFDDLPSEDSCLEDEENEHEEDEYEDLLSAQDDDDDDDDIKNLTSSKENDQELMIGDRIYMRRHTNGKMKTNDYKEKKSKALSVAYDRLNMIRKLKKTSTNEDESKYSNDQYSHSSDSSSADEDSTNSTLQATNSDKQTLQKGCDKERKRKRSKHAPASASSRRPSYYNYRDLNSSGLGVTIGSKRYKPQDPRFQSLSGYFNQDIFEKRYAFLEEKQNEDIEKLQKKIKALRETGKKGQKMRKKLGLTNASSAQVDRDETELKRLLQERASRRQEQVARAAKRTVKRRLREEVASGKRGAFHVKRRDLKKLEMDARLEELKSRGGEAAVAKALAKRRKRKLGVHGALMPKSSS